MTDLNKIFLYRMTHIENIPHILKYGITHIHSPNANKNYVPIGDGSLISTRISFLIPNDKKLGDYIPFYFGARMPMLYVVQKGFNNVKATPAADIIYCVTSVGKIIDENLDYVFTDGHAIDLYSTFYYEKDIDSIENCIDKKAINSKYWKSDNDLDLKRRKEAEFLVGNDIPRAAIIGFAVYNEKAKDKLIEFGVNEKIIVNPEYYF